MHGSAAPAFPRQARMLEGADFAQVFKRNQRHTNKYWILLVHRKAEGEARLGLAIAKKRAKRAVDRNRIKRVARESFRHQRSMLGSVDVVIMNKDAASSASTLELRKTLDSLWNEQSDAGGKGDSKRSAHSAANRSRG